MATYDWCHSVNNIKEKVSFYEVRKIYVPKGADAYDFIPCDRECQKGLEHHCTCSFRPVNSVGGTESWKN
jgi:hypothetical protein